MLFCLVLSWNGRMVGCTEGKEICMLLSNVGVCCFWGQLIPVSDDFVKQLWWCTCVVGKWEMLCKTFIFHELHSSWLTFNQPINNIDPDIWYRQEVRRSFKRNLNRTLWRDTILVDVRTSRTGKIISIKKHKQCNVRHLLSYRLVAKHNESASCMNMLRVCRISFSVN